MFILATLFSWLVCENIVIITLRYQSERVISRSRYISGSLPHTPKWWSKWK